MDGVQKFQIVFQIKTKIIIVFNQEYRSFFPFDHALIKVMVCVWFCNGGSFFFVGRYDNILFRNAISYNSWLDTRNCYPETTAFANFTFNVDTASVYPDKLFGNGEPDSAAYINDTLWQV